MQLEERGVATTTIVTSGFRQAAEAHRRLLKHPALPVCVVPHPIVSMSDAELAASADAILAEVVATISRAQAGGQDSGPAAAS